LKPITREYASYCTDHNSDIRQQNRLASVGTPVIVEQ